MYAIFALYIIAGSLVGGAVAVLVMHRYHLKLERELISRIIEKSGARPLDVPLAPPPEKVAMKKPLVDRLRFKV